MAIQYFLISNVSSISNEIVSELKNFTSDQYALYKSIEGKINSDREDSITRHEFKFIEDLFNECPDADEIDVVAIESGIPDYIEFDV